MAVSAGQYKRRQTEAQFQRAVVQAAEQLGWIAVHFPAMLANPSGFPDLILIKGRRTVFAELKRFGGRLGPKQAEWIDALQATGAEIHVWYPDQWPEIEATLKGAP